MAGSPEARAGDRGNPRISVDGCRRVAATQARPTVANAFSCGIVSGQSGVTPHMVCRAVPITV